MPFDKDSTHEKFDTARWHYENLNYEKSIELFSEIIVEAKKYPEVKQAMVTLETALTNRGMGKCKTAQIKGDKNLFIEGVNDIEEAVALDPETEKNPQRTAVMQLTIAKDELLNFDDDQKKEEI